MATNSDTALLATYGAAIELITGQAADWWSRFQALLLANSIVLAAIPFLTERGYVLAVVASLGGLALCFAWRRLLDLGFDNLRYWYAVGQELEGQIGTFNILRRHQLLSQGQRVEVGGLQMQIPGRRPAHAVEWAGRIIWLFVVGYLLALALILWPLIHHAFGVWPTT